MDIILFWSAVVRECNRLDHTTATPPNPAYNRGPTNSSRAAAIGHIAMHDAFFGVKGFGGLPGGTPKTQYLNPAITYGLGTSTDPEVASAVSGAASTVLATLYPGFRPMIEAKVAEIAGMRGSSSAAFVYGEQIASAVLKLRGHDRDNNLPDSGHAASPAPYRHRPDPISPGQGYLGVGYGTTSPFFGSVIAPLTKPPLPTSGMYKNHYKEVYELGGAPLLNKTVRTPDQTAIGLMWGYDGSEKLGTPPRMFNQILEQIASEMGNSEDENARLFALANAAMGDCGIYAWRDKYVYDLWRPIIGIRENDTKSVGPSVTDGIADKSITPPCDPFWLPYGRPATNRLGEFFRTPDFPSYPSGHATFGGAVFEMVRLFFKEKAPAAHPYGPGDIDNISFSWVSDEMNGSSIDPDGSIRPRHNREFSSVAEAMYDNAVSRVYLGVHWRFDGTTGTSPKTMLQAVDRIGGVPLGRDIATHVFANFRQP